VRGRTTFASCALLGVVVAVVGVGVLPLIGGAATDGAGVAVAAEAAPVAGASVGGAPVVSVGAGVPPAVIEILANDIDVVLFPNGRRPAPRPPVTVLTRVRAKPDAIGAVLLDPARYHAALPPLLRADVVGTRPGPAPGPADAAYGPERLLDWELEFPFFNLKGRAWLSRRAETIELSLIEGAFAPGRLSVRLAPAAGDGPATVMTSTVQIEPRSANWIIRRIVAHDPWAETAMTAAAALVLTRAVALLAESAGGPPARPKGPMTPPSVGKLDGGALAGVAAVLGRGAGAIAIVRRAPSGRLAWVSTAVPLAGAPAVLAPRLAAPETWRAFPGWKSVTRLPPGGGSPAPPPGQIDFEVTDDIAFVDLDAVWRVPAGLPGRARALEGTVAGAVLAWQALPGATADATTAVLSLYPRLDLAGFIEKRMVAAEPLLEHAFALALSYADAVAVAAALDSAREGRALSAP